MSSPVAVVKSQQLEWAGANGIRVDDRGYTLKRDDNLFQPLSSQTLADFSAGQGGELDDSHGRAKMFALHSSSALGCNFFEYWRTRNSAPLSQALRLPYDVAAVRFEDKFPTGVSTPNLDMVLELQSGHIVAIESKFLEPYGSSHAGGLKEKYFDLPGGRWSQVGLPGCETLAHFGTMLVRSTLRTLTTCRSATSRDRTYRRMEQTRHSAR